MHMMKKKSQDKASNAPIVVNASASKRSFSRKANGSVMASLFASKAKSPPAAAAIASTESSPTKEEGEFGGAAYESEFARGFRKELSKRLAEPLAAAHPHKHLGLDFDDNSHCDDDNDAYEDDCDTTVIPDATDIRHLQRQLRALVEANAESEDAWRRENTRLREQLAASSKREILQTQQIRDFEDQLAKHTQELERLRKTAASSSSNTAPPHRSPLVPSPLVATAHGDDYSIREREMLRLIMELTGKDAIRSLLSENPHATPAQLRQELVQLHRQQEQEQPSPFSFRMASERSNSPPPRGASSKSTKQQSQRHLVLDGSSPALDAIYEK